MKINVLKYIIAGIGVLFTTLAVIWHVLEDGGPWQPIIYLMNFPAESGALLAIGLFALLSAKGLPARK